MRYLNEQKRPQSPDSEAFRKQRIAAAGVFNVKSRHQKDKEEAERKRVEEEEKAAKAYRDFVADMQGGDGDEGERKRGFVRAGDSSSYIPSSRHHGPTSASASIPLAPRAMRAPDTSVNHAATAWNDVNDDDVAESSRQREGPGKRKRAMNDFLGELQRDQAQREERLRSRVADGTSISTLLAQEAEASRPWDHQSPVSSNVCVLNLPSNVSEATFAEYFSRYGDVASVKIMWPRTEDAVAPGLRCTRSPGATGFVNFMTRSDAERAHHEIEGSSWMGSLLRTGWGKPLRKSAQPICIQSAAAKRNLDAGQATSREPGTGERHTRSSRSPQSRNHRRRRERSAPPLDSLRAAVVQRHGEDVEKRISAVASRVKEYGRAFEEMVQEKEADNREFAFLQDTDSLEYQYFRTLFDKGFEPRLPAAPFCDDGTDSLYSSVSEEDSEWEKLQRQQKSKELGKAARRRLEAMLRGITPRRERIARVMLFAIEHAAAAETVSRIIVDSLLQPGTPLSRKMARLYVVSDILHNSSVSASNAWRYRSLFESMLDRVFLHWGDVSNSFTGRIKREGCKDMVRNMFNVWDNWLVYENAKLVVWREYVEFGSARAAAGGEEEQGDAVPRDMDGEQAESHPL